MCSNIDYTNLDVCEDTTRWGEWMVNDIRVDGFRLDAVQHFSFNFTKDWIQSVNDAYRQRTNGSKDVFVVGEVWSGDLSRIKAWLNAVQHPSGHPRVYAYDAPLLYNFSRISKDICNRSRNIDLRTILRNSLLESRPEAAITLVTNHDTQPGQTSYAPMPRQLKLLWYAFILLRKEGLPCVFWGDLFGTKGRQAEPAVGTKDREDQRGKMLSSSPLAKLMLCRKYLAYGGQRDYLDSAWTVGWTREGKEGKDGSGCAVVLSVAPVSKANVTKKMQVGRPGEVWIDVLDPAPHELAIDAKGIGSFPVKGPGVSVFARKGSEKMLELPQGLDANVYDK
jgi:alpha-amylase